MAKTKICRYCGEKLERKRYTGGTMENPAKFALRQFCDKLCSNRYTSRGIAERAAKQPKRRTVRAQPSSKPKKASVHLPQFPKPLNANTQRPSKLPDPRGSRWLTVASARPETPCALHPTERASSCTVCGIAPRHQNRKPIDSTPAYRRRV